MSKTSYGENNLMAYEANGTAMPNYGANLGVSLHIADPGEAGLYTTNAATYTNYAPTTVSRDALGLTICDGTNPYAANPNGSGYKNAAQITFPQSDPGFVGPEGITYVAIYDLTTGKILRRAQIGAPSPYTLLVGPNSTPFFPPGTLIWLEA
jgi:hypothetical protein